MSPRQRQLVALCTCVIILFVVVLFHPTLQNITYGLRDQIHDNAFKLQFRVVSEKHVKENEENPAALGNSELKFNKTFKNETLRRLQDGQEKLSHSENESSLPKQSYTKDTPIDLDISVPSVDDLYDRLVLVTAFSSNHYNEAMGFIGSAQKQMPGKKIIVYDLGLNETMKEQVEKLCQVELRPFPFDSYPDHVRTLVTYAFKPILINLALKEFGAIYYGDASIRFLKSLKKLLPGIERHHGFMTVIRGFDPRNMTDNVIHHYFLTVPEMFQKLKINQDEYFNSNFSAPHIQPGTQLIINSTTIQTKLIQPWLQCALEEACIAPPGSSKRNHRQDASAITLIVYKNLYREWTPEDNDTDKMRSVIMVRRNSDGFRHHPQYCK